MKKFLLSFLLMASVALATPLSSFFGYITNGAPPFSGTQSLQYNATSSDADCGTIMRVQPTTAFSILLWTFPTTGSDFAWVTNALNTGGVDAGLFFGRLSGDLYVQLVNNLGTTNYIAVDFTTSNFSLSRWNMVALTYSGSSTAAGFKVYACRDTTNGGDGNCDLATPSVDQDTLSGTITYLTDTHIGNWNNASEWFGGDLTQVQFYTSTLSSSTLTSIFNAGLLQNVFSFGPANWFQMVGPVGPDTTSTLHDSITAATCAGSNLTIVNSVPN